MSSRPRLLRTLFCSWLTMCLAIVAGCSEPPPPPASQKEKSCQDCHQLQLDQHHQLACISCHQGIDPAPDQQTAHQGLISQPAHPEHLQTSCGKCHPQASQSIQQSAHFLLPGYLWLRAQYSGQPIAHPEQIPVTEPPDSLAALADDMLRRRCLRCHPYWQGENYPATRHGTGCAACHLQRHNGALKTHALLARPGDEVCLSCHYGNHVGADYHGRFEHDFNQEYRTPYTTRDEHFRPYGLEYHQLIPDIHQQRGLLCIDCHRGAELMGNDPAARRARCAGCHDRKELAVFLPAGVSLSGQEYVFTSRTGNNHPLPLTQHPAHQQFGDHVSCQACHAQWAFSDENTQLIRIDHQDFDQWEMISTQGSAEIEEFLDKYLTDSDNDMMPRLRDGLTGDFRPGIWLQGYRQRRWENIQLGRDEHGRIQVYRPILDISLSWVDSNEQLRFDGQALITQEQRWQPYTPHTTGPAGLFYQERLRALDAKESRNKAARSGRLSAQ